MDIVAGFEALRMSQGSVIEIVCRAFRYTGRRLSSSRTVKNASLSPPYSYLHLSLTLL